MNNLQTDKFKNFQDVAKGYNIEITDNQLELFKKYYEILLEWNKKINLISRKEESILKKHFLDSIIFLPEIETLATCYLPLTTVLDIGSGGGFPAVPLAIMKPNWHFILCESIKKKGNFLFYLIGELGLKNVEIINTRVEVLHATPLQKKFDFVTARAVVKLNELIKYALPLLKKNSHLLAYKTKNIEEEINDTERLIEKNKLKLQIFSKEINGVIRKLIVVGT